MSKTNNSTHILTYSGLVQCLDTPYEHLGPQPCLLYIINVTQFIKVCFKLICGFLFASAFYSALPSSFEKVVLFYISPAVLAMHHRSHLITETVQLVSVCQAGEPVKCNSKALNLTIMCKFENYSKANLWRKEGQKV